ncbi:hypothetical protein P3T36_000018 [Kitasatospora sp. MAP12-15]|nr:hypothetical protein [Kitasatospora sp. MAP12-44]
MGRLAFNIGRVVGAAEAGEITHIYLQPQPPGEALRVLIQHATTDLEETLTVHGAGHAVQRGWTSRKARTADSRAPSIQAGFRLVCSPAKCTRPSTVRVAGCSSCSWPGVKMTASPSA